MIITIKVIVAITGITINMVITAIMATAAIMAVETITVMITLISKKAMHIYVAIIMTNYYRHYNYYYNGHYSLNIIVTILSNKAKQYICVSAL